MFGEMRRFEFVKRLDRGLMIPAWYGVAWQDIAMDRLVCMPVPFNIFASLGRGVWAFLRFGYLPVCDSQRAAYWQGFKDGQG